MLLAQAPPHWARCQPRAMPLGGQRVHFDWIRRGGAAKARACRWPWQQPDGDQLRRTPVVAGRCALRPDVPGVSGMACGGANPYAGMLAGPMSCGDTRFGQYAQRSGRHRRAADLRAPAAARQGRTLRRRSDAQRRLHCTKQASVTDRPARNRRWRLVAQRLGWSQARR